MSIQDNKRIVERFSSHFERSAIDEILSMMSENAIWWIKGKPHLFSGAGKKTKPEMEQIWHDLYASLQGGLKMEVLDMVAEGDRVAAEIRSFAFTKTGKVYENDYHMLFTIQDGKIIQVKEYTDLMHAAEVFL
ncbi:nuclear transport factor 2 family protein [Halomonas sp. SBBP1]|uniref:nuclear transport factor 2 family protein n=2 Tax=unclassified Halomonas TaxID=2609666 RepID=UPI001CF5AB4A|nr:nuclear transport factor 2 family protein [Halomonas sp. SBBP1]MCA8864604.1 nuclear transport factor 2 family protein [Halomonas sp. SBBP1]